MEKTHPFGLALQLTGRAIHTSMMEDGMTGNQKVLLPVDENKDKGAKPDAKNDFVITKRNLSIYF